MPQIATQVKAHYTRPRTTEYHTNIAKHNHLLTLVNTIYCYYLCNK